MTEEQEQRQVFRYVQWQYPDIIFNADMGGVRVPIGLAKKMKSLGNCRAFPDINIPEPRGKYYGLYIELKRTNTKLKKKNGDWVNDHVAEQADMLEKLRQRGYYAEFAIGFEHCKNIIDEYLMQ